MLAIGSKETPRPRIFVQLRVFLHMEFLGNNKTIPWGWPDNHRDLLPYLIF